jgi:hypothetical protein
VQPEAHRTACFTQKLIQYSLQLYLLGEGRGYRPRSHEHNNEIKIIPILHWTLSTVRGVSDASLHAFWKLILLPSSDEPTSEMLRILNIA